jgi:hypothetical protein
MKKIFAMATLLVACWAQAGDWYGAATYNQKDKLNSAQVNYVHGLTIGNRLGDGWAAEGSVETERVEVGNGTQKQEGAYQVKVVKDFATGTMFTPYLAGAIGQKNKPTLDFSYYLYEGGVKIKLNDTFGIRLGSRQRTAFDNNTTNSYDTREDTIALGISLTKKDSISLAYKQERGTSNYNTNTIVYTRSF